MHASMILLMFAPYRSAIMWYSFARAKPTYLVMLVMSLPISASTGLMKCRRAGENDSKKRPIFSKLSSLYAPMMCGRRFISEIAFPCNTRSGA